MEENTNNVSKKNWLTTLMLCWFLGFLGVHRLYAGKLGTGFLMAYGTVVSACILTLNIWLGLGAFVVVGGFVVNDFIIIAIKRVQDFYGRDIADDKAGL